MTRRFLTLAILLPVILASTTCENKPAQITELKYFPMDNLDNLISSSNVEFDSVVSSDGTGSVRISVPESTTVRLFEIDDIDVDNARLIYQARVRTENLEGTAFLEMLCHFPGKGDAFSRDLQSPLTGTMDWTSEETPFFLKKGEKPDAVKLNLVIGGKGTVWIDDIHLLKAPLQ